MKPLIVPAIIAKNQNEFNERYDKIKFQDYVHLDVMDGKFVRNKSLMFDFKLPRDKGKKYVAHLMVSNPERWIDKNLDKVNSVLIHVESLGNLEGVIDKVKKRGKGIGIVLNPKTPISKVKKYANRVGGFLIMTVNPGKYGSKFLSLNLRKIKELKALNKNLQIGVDGGINNKTIKKARKAGADIFVVGSYLQKSEDVEEKYGELGEKI